jgi:hypothetical protein
MAWVSCEGVRTTGVAVLLAHVDGDKLGASFSRASTKFAERDNASGEFSACAKLNGTVQLSTNPMRSSQPVKHQH